METLLSSLQNMTSFVIPMIVLLGLLIFVHELGHFLVAKYYKVKVEVFSLGFGPKIFTFQGKETQYAVSVIPLGGYVKMFGHDGEEDIPESERSRSFLSKPVGQRIAIVLAGPLMNLFFAGVLFTLIAFVGERALHPKVGDVLVNTEAYNVGFRSGDVVQSVNGHKVQRWADFQELLEDNPNRNLEVTVLRELTEEVVTLNFQNQIVPSDNILSLNKEVGGLPGLERLSSPTLVGVDNPNSPAGLAGLKAGDEIKKVDGIEVQYWREMSRLLSQRTGQAVELEVLRRADLSDPTGPMETLNLTLQMPTRQQLDYAEWISGDLGRDIPQLATTKPASLELMAAVGLHPSETFVWRVPEGTPASQAGIQPGDHVVAINDTPIRSFRDILSIVSGFQPSQGSLEFTLARDGQTEKLSITPTLDQADRRSGNYEPRYVVGIQPMQNPVPPPTFVWKTSNPIQGLAVGMESTWEWTKMTLVSFYKLITNEVSPKNLGGFLSIGQMAQKSWELGISTFFRAMAILSINLFIINLLPVPVLDGGHLVFYTIEAIRGAPVSMRKLEIAQQVGLVMLLFLMAYALFNDFSRLFNS